MDTPRKAKSPYQRYKKVPYRYSDALRAWENAVRTGKPAAEVDRLARAHSATLGIRYPVRAGRDTALLEAAE